MFKFCEGQRAGQSIENIHFIEGRPPAAALMG
jgi:hypothetical protein